MAQTSGVLAIEFAPSAPQRPVTLPTHEAALLLDAVAADLARLAPAASDCDLVAVGALYDAAQLLRPGWPIEAELARLRQGLGAKAAGQVVAFGAAGGSLPSPVLEPEPALAGGALHHLPWLLLGEAKAIAAATADLERCCQDEGLASAAVHLFLRQTLGEEIAHCRYLTRNDLLALTALQLDHAGLGPVWPIIETALFAPNDGVAVELPSAGSLAFARGRVTANTAGLDAHFAAADGNLETAVEAFVQSLFFQRRAAALLAAHAVPTSWRLIRVGATDPVEHIGVDRATWPEGAKLIRLTDPALGVAGLAVEAPASKRREAWWPLSREVLLTSLREAETAARDGRASFETKTLTEWASVL